MILLSSALYMNGAAPNREDFVSIKRDSSYRILPVMKQKLILELVD